MAKKKLSEKPTCEPKREPPLAPGTAELSDIGQLRQSSNKSVVLISASQPGENASKLIRLVVKIASLLCYYRHLYLSDMSFSVCVGFQRISPPLKKTEGHRCRGRCRLCSRCELLVSSARHSELQIPGWCSCFTTHLCFTGFGAFFFFFDGWSSSGRISGRT